MSKIRPISIIQSMSGKVCEHSDMYFRTNKQTQQVCTGKICYPSDTELSAAQVRVQERFTKISAAVYTYTTRRLRNMRISGPHFSGLTEIIAR